MIESVLFDVDGTLFDDDQYVRAGLRRAAAELERRTGVAATAEIFETYYEEGRTERTFDHVLAANDLSLELVPALVDAYHRHTGRLTPYPGVRTTLDELGERYELGVVTGGRNGRTKLEKLGVADAFGVVVVTPEQGTTKRQPDPFEEALTSLDVPASKAVYVGDRPSLDFPQPNRLDMYTVQVVTDRADNGATAAEETPDAVVERFRSLPSVVGRLDGEAPE